MNYELVFIRVCKLPTAYDIDFFICFQNQAKCKDYCKLSCKSSVTAKFICNTLISYNFAWKFMQYLTQVWIIMSIKYLFFLFSCVSGHTWAVSENNSQHSYHLILEEQRIHFSCHQGYTRLDTPSIFLWHTVVSVQTWKQALHQASWGHARLLQASLSCWNVVWKDIYIWGWRSCYNQWTH